ncbi:hypothetical protein A0H81_09057 [Grifola frondosa]|uniref:Uncharacterized protein n=1 Tax=Grifola frondosa TaxID=5627 RepID=A0A1C7M273_GRIFR|nr:hypothetical protein A0H81_09057 [Grifola frondosa]
MTQRSPVSSPPCSLQAILASIHPKLSFPRSKLESRQPKELVRHGAPADFLLVPEGSYVTLGDERELLDFTCGIGVPTLVTLVHASAVLASTALTSSSSRSYSP